MKIAYILDDDISFRSGIVNKIDSKISIWKKYGHDIQVYSLRSKNNISCIENGVIISNLGINKNILEKFFAQYRNIKKLKKELMDFKPDIIYVRHMKYYFGLVDSLKKTANYVVEINSNDLVESKMNKAIVHIYNILTRSIFLKNASGFISVSNELIDNPIFKKFHKPSIVIGNGYNFNSVNHIRVNSNTITKLVFIGTPGQSWHGIDKVITMAKYFKDCEFHVIGFRKEELQTDSQNVIAYGYLSQDKSEEIISNCNIGISTLALHRKDMNEASPLKSRQYLAHGLPIIIGYSDTDIKTSFEYILNIGNDENNVINNHNIIRTFIEKIKYIDSEKIKKEMKEIIDYEGKELLRINFIKHCKEQT